MNAFLWLYRTCNRKDTGNQAKHPSWKFAQIPHRTCLRLGEGLKCVYIKKNKPVNDNLEKSSLKNGSEDDKF